MEREGREREGSVQGKRKMELKERIIINLISDRLNPGCTAGGADDGS